MKNSMYKKLKIKYFITMLNLKYKSYFSFNVITILTMFHLKLTFFVALKNHFICINIYIYNTTTSVEKINYYTT